MGLINTNLSAKDIENALRDRFSRSGWVFVNELRVGTGYGSNSEQRLDGWAINCWRNKRDRRSIRNLSFAFEIKISTNDFLHELLY